MHERVIVHLVVGASMTIRPCHSLLLQYHWVKYDNKTLSLFVVHHNLLHWIALTLLSILPSMVLLVGPSLTANGVFMTLLNMLHQMNGSAVFIVASRMFGPTVLNMLSTLHSQSLQHLWSC